jgi:general secretion pathway protein D
MAAMTRAPIQGLARLGSLVTLACVLVGCVTQPPVGQKFPQLVSAPEVDPAQAPLPTPTTSMVEVPRPDNSFYSPGSGELIGRPSSTIVEAKQSDGEIKLNFQDANLLEVVKVVLGDMLGASYVIDPAVQGIVTMQTSSPLSRQDLLPTLELLLRMNEAALLSDGPIYRIVPLVNAVAGVRAPQLGDSALPLPRGYSVRLVPLRHVAAEEMAQILEPFIAGGNNLLRVDTQRNLIILAGSGDDMARLLETVRMFDVDRMQGMSVAMFTPDFVDAKTLGEELEQLLADPQVGLMSGLVRFMVVERLNGLLVVTTRPDYLARVRSWVQRLDRESGGAGRRLFIYRVQNGRAADLAEVLNQLFESERQGEGGRVNLAPGLQPVTTRSVPDTEVEAPVQAPAPVNPAEGFAISPEARVRVIADEPNNALLILASAQEYRQILTALGQLDAVPLQVLIEVTIAEVSLTNNLEYGVEWFFKNNPGSFDGRGTLELGLVDFGAAGIAGAASGAQGFSYALTKGGSVRALLNMLDRESRISIVSSPSLLVLNNQEARIQVGDEISIKTAEQSTVTVGDSTALNSTFERRETGVLLAVKPRVNPGGLVIMEVEQEVSNVPQADVGSDNPRIQQRKIKSSVAVQSGDSVVLGGLIRDNRDSSEAGVPGLHKIPLFGALFGTKGNNTDRAELLVLITPRAIADRHSALQVTEEFRRKLNRLLPPTEPVIPAAPGTASASAVVEPVTP